jgi:precorrin-2 dehydrogenase/sirohydrochlorin ferrochelatase
MPESTNPVLPGGVYYPVFLNLKDRRVVVVGGGKVAERKVLALLRCGADLTVVSPEITRNIEREKKKGGIKHIRRQYRKADLRAAFLVIAATDSPEINERVSRDAPCLVNVVDTPHLCNFIVPSVIKRGALTIAISTGGISPALSRSVREELEKIFGAEFSAYLKSLKCIRMEAMKGITDRKRRTEFLKSLASAEMLRILRKKGCGEAKRRAMDSLKKAKRKGD